MAIEASGRDILTGATTSDIELIENVAFDVVVGSDRRIVRCDDRTGRHDLSRFRGVRIGRDLREAMAEGVTGAVKDGTLMRRLFQELPPLSFLGHGARVSWETAPPPPRGRREEEDKRLRTVEGLCITYKPGSKAMTDAGTVNLDLIRQPLGPLATDSEDNWAWHEIRDFEGPHFLRIRRQDVWLDADRLQVDQSFQDAARANNEAAPYRIYHEYRVHAGIDPDEGVLREVRMDSGVLPFDSCTTAKIGPNAFLGKSVGQFEAEIPRILSGTAGCTHLNGTLQTLGDAIALQQNLARYH